MKLTIENTTIGFVGTGVMGKSMARNLLKAGYRVHVFNRTKEKAQELVREGCIWSETIAELSRTANVIITMIGTPAEVQEVYFGTDGIFEHARLGTYLIDTTSSKPSLAKEIFREASKRAMHALDAPVSGGDIGAREGTLAIMVGGEQEDFDAVKPILEAIGQNIVLQGKAGSGQHTKICNQVTIAPAMIGVCEAIVYAEKAGLDPTKVIKSIETGAAGSFSLSRLGPRMIAGDFAPGFYVKHFIKDMTIALESAKELGIMTPGLELAKRMYEELARKGEESSGTQALIKYYY